jgi:phosphate transport system substrate-binding protein
MGNQSNLVIYAIIALIIGAGIGYFAAGPVSYNQRINQLQQDLEECQQQEPPTLSGTLTMGGSTTVAPIAQECIRLFIEANSQVTGSYAPTGSGSGVRSAGAGEIDIGGASRNIKASEFLRYPSLVAFAIAKDSVAVVINPDNPLAGDLDITLEQVSEIFSGEIQNWNELGGPDEEINVYTREEGSGTRETFVDYGMFGKEFAPDASVQNSNGAMRASVAEDEWGIAYISLGYVDESVSPVQIDGVIPSVESVKAGDYPITRILWMFTNGMPSSIEEAFIEFVLSEEGQQVVQDQGFIALYL